MTLLDSSSVGFQLELDEIFNDSTKCRAVLQNNEDKIEEFNKWSENMVRFVKTILEEAHKMSQMLPNLESQIDKFASFQDAFGVHRTVEAFDTISNLLKNTQSSNYKLVTKISSRLLLPLQKYFQEDFKSLKDSRKSFDKTSEKYDGLLNRYYSLSKFKDISDLEEDLVQLYDARVAYFEQYSEHATKIKNFKETIDLLFLEKITILIDDLSDFFKNLSENFNSVKLQLDKGKDEYEKLNKKSEEKRTKNEEDRNDLIQAVREKWDSNATIVRKLSSEKVGNLMMKKKKPALVTPWKRIFAIISDGQFSYETAGKIRGTLECHEKLNVMMCEIRPIDLNDRRFCFEIYTGQQSQIYQAESEDDMMDWINTFHTAKSEMLQKRKSPVMPPSTPSMIETVPDDLSTAVFDYKNQSALKKWNEDLHKQFTDLLESEVTLCSFPASLHTDIWTQGRVFVSQYAVYFYSSLFGIGTKIIIPLKEIMKIDVVQTSFVTVINFTLSGESKDVTLKTFNSVDDSSSIFIDHLQLLHRNTQSSDPRDSFALFNEIREKSIENSSVVVVEEEDMIDDTETILSAQVSNEEAPLPTKEVSCGCLNHMDKRSVNTIIPIDCAMAFDLMFGPKCPVQRAIQIKRKNKNYKISDWRTREADGIEERQEFYMFPLNNPLSRAKETECYVTISLIKNIPGRCYVVECKTNTPNIPYADSFYTQTRYCITWAGPEQTRISICLGITWLKSPFVKSIIKSATHKTFDDTCLDYMGCLRKEIAAKIGPIATVGDSIDGQINSSKKDLDGQNNLLNQSNDQITSDQSSSNQDNLLFRIIDGIMAYKLPIVVFLFAFLLGRFFGNGNNRPNIISSYDLEMEVLKDLNVSRTFPVRTYEKWSSPKFQKSHSQLTRLHQEFGIVRKTIWFTLKRVNELERRVYKAEVAALMGDRLLSCYDQRDSPTCKLIQEQWKLLMSQK